MTERNVKCPACGKTVTPRSVTSTATPAAPAAGTPSGERWSFAWRPPSGSVCPECLFPLERYLRRRPWIVTFRVGVIFTTVAVLLQLGVYFQILPAALSLAVRIAGALGALGLLVGGVGMVVGGRHAAEGSS